MSKRLRNTGFVTLLIVLAACTSRPTATPRPTVVPTITPTTFSVSTLAPAPTSAPATPTVRGTPNLATAVIGAVDPSQPQPARIIQVGAPVLSLPENGPDNIIGLEMNPASPKELIVSLYNGVAPRAERVRWSGEQPVRDPLPGEALQLRYSPDGSQVAVNGLGLISLDKLAPASPIAPDGIAPGWSPDGKQIAFIRRLPATTPECKGPDAEACSSVVIYDIAKKSERTVRIQPYLGGPPEWSPDQKRLLVTLSGEVGSVLEMLEIDTGRLQQLVPNLDAPPEANTYTDSIWTSDSRAVIYTTQAGALFLLPLNGQPPRLLSEAATRIHLAEGTNWVYYLRPVPTDRQGVRAYEVWRLDYTEARRDEKLSDAALYCNEAAWSPKADILACTDVINEQRSILLYAVPTGAPVATGQAGK